MCPFPPYILRLDTDADPNVNYIIPELKARVFRVIWSKEDMDAYGLIPKPPGEAYTIECPDVVLKKEFIDLVHEIVQHDPSLDFLEIAYPDRVFHEY